MDVSITLSNRQLTILLTSAAIFYVVGSGMSYVAGGSRVFAVVALALALLLVAGSVGFALHRARGAVEVTPDDGGLRIGRGLVGEYLPYRSLRRASLARSFGRSILQLDASSGVRAYALSEGHGDDLADVVTAGVARSSVEPSASPAALSRGGQPLDAWFERVRRAATGGEGYREGALDTADLVRLVDDTSADVELRAAAIHALVSLRDPEKSTRALDTVGRMTPPLVIVGAATATKHGTYVAPLEGALRFLTPADRAATEKLLEARTS